MIAGIKYSISFPKTADFNHMYKHRRLIVWYAIETFEFVQIEE